jgi:polar amino acid transport system substrate-binding protein
MATPPLTLTPGELRVASAFPDPPFEVEQDGMAGGFDVELMRAIAARLGLRYRTLRYTGDDFNGIFAGLDGQYDAVISGTTITPERERRARFSAAYLEFNQGLVVDRERTPHARSTDDLHGQVVGIHRGNTSDVVARRLLAAGVIARIAY